MTWQTLAHPGNQPVLQFSLFMANKLGRLYDISALLHRHNVHILALTILDTTDSAILRLIVDDPDRARSLLNEHAFPFTETAILVVEVDVETRLGAVLAALLEAEINIHYMYAFLALPAGRPLLALNVEDHDTAVEALKRHQIRVFNQADLSR
jgi:hypothetical protein